MRILAIETSCDDTCVAIIDAFGQKSPKFKVLSNIISSQIEIHKKWGGVYPALAKREHQQNLVPVLEKALSSARLLNLRFENKKEELKFKIQKLNKILERELSLCKKLTTFLKKYEKPNIDTIAVTKGPGLEPCLWTGINLAKSLSYFWNLPIVSVNHIESHIFANWLKVKDKKFKIRFPAICLIVSGGHTQLILMQKIGSYTSRDILTPFKYKILGETRDDAAGECLDKVARIMGLGYPGGPIIETYAAEFQSSNAKSKINLPRPMIYQKNFDFSFSGLKTAVLYDYKNRSQGIRESKKFIQELSAEVQRAIIDVLVLKTIKATKEYKAKTLLIGGGVAANNELRKRLKAESLKYRINFRAPPKNLCTDNSAMVAVAGYFRKIKKK